jgi:hypothetical protein
MRRLLLIAGLFVILIIGGGLTTQLIANQTTGAPLLPFLTQTINPDASRTVLLPWKAEQFFLLVGFLIFNLIGIAATIALLFWFADRGVRRNAASKQPSTDNKQIQATE